MSTWFEKRGVPRGTKIPEALLSAEALAAQVGCTARFVDQLLSIDIITPDYISGNKRLFRPERVERVRKLAELSFQKFHDAEQLFSTRELAPLVNAPMSVVHRGIHNGTVLPDFVSRTANNKRPSFYYTQSTVDRLRAAGAPVMVPTHLEGIHDTGS